MSVARALARAVLAVALLLAAGPGRADEALWAALADGGHVALMRHAAGARHG